MDTLALVGLIVVGVLIVVDFVLLVVFGWLVTRR